MRRAHPEWTMKYSIDWWMNPGVPEVRQQAVAVMLDVTRRYDVDGIHIDDYFYPYPITDSAKKKIEFPDSDTYARYKAAGGTLELTAWRRQNVDQTVQATSGSPAAPIRSTPSGRGMIWPSGTATTSPHPRRQAR